jgi:hypothetical protein
MEEERGRPKKALASRLAIRERKNGASGRTKEWIGKEALDEGRLI